MVGSILLFYPTNVQVGAMAHGKIVKVYTVGFISGNFIRIQNSFFKILSYVCSLLKKLPEKAFFASFPMDLPPPIF